MTASATAARRVPKLLPRGVGGGGGEGGASQGTLRGVSGGGEARTVETSEKLLRIQSPYFSLPTSSRFPTPFRSLDTLPGPRLRSPLQTKMAGKIGDCEPYKNKLMHQSKTQITPPSREERSCLFAHFLDRLISLALSCIICSTYFASEILYYRISYLQVFCRVVVLTNTVTGIWGKFGCFAFWKIEKNGSHKFKRFAWKQ